MFCLRQCGRCLIALIFGVGWLWAAPVEPGDLWSLRPIRRPEIPRWPDPGVARNPIDHFVLAALAKQELSPSPSAGRATLIRRLSYDLIGLPPTPSEIDAFLHDTSADAYERLVESYLARPQYGERWARHWLDLARYTESQGFEYDHMRENAWQYRDYVIASFNNDKPYNQFVKEQIAGDALESVTSETMIATSFLVCGAWDQAGSSQANVTQRLITREEELEDMISVVGQTFLGLTVNCARCHSHKFDPIAQADYYRVKSVFEGVRHGERTIAPPAEVLAREVEIGRLKAQLADSHEVLSGISCPDAAAAGAGSREMALCQYEEATENLRTLRPLPVSYIGLRQQPEPTHRLKRGDVRSPLEVVTPGGLSALAPLSGDLGLAADAPEAQRRLRFAEWIVDPLNPLTARVLVNRLWQHHFGQGIVATPNDFGSSGARPSHPELLDWLASYLIDQHWSIKAVQRVILSSATYQQASTYRAAAAQRDADNRWLWRFAPQRLESEEIRDAILSVSGQLNLAVGGPSFRPFDTKSFNATFYIPKDKVGPEFDRRTVYRMNINSGKDPLLEAFDCPDPSVKTPRRGITTTPLQALALMNSSFVQRQAQHLAERLCAEAGGDGPRALELGYRYCFGHLPSAPELQDAEGCATMAGLQTVCWALLNATEFLYVR
jgi:hypothetical protein